MNDVMQCLRKRFNTEDEKAKQSDGCLHDVAKTVADCINHESIGFFKSANFIKVISVLCLYCASVVLQQTRRVATRK